MVVREAFGRYTLKGMSDVPHYAEFIRTHEL